MPTYDYVCDACGHAFEHFQSMSSAHLRACPACKKKKLRRLIGSGAGVIFKGGGFYETDYKKGRSGGKSESSSSESSSTSSESSSTSKEASSASSTSDTSTKKDTPGGADASVKSRKGDKGDTSDKGSRKGKDA